MSNRLMELALALKERYPYRDHPKNFAFDFIGVECAGWLRVYLGTDRHFVLREREEIIKLVESFGLAPSFDVSWVWQTVYNEEYNVHFRQATPLYAVFVCGTDKRFQNLLPYLSDTSDELYDFECKDLMEAISKNRTTPCSIKNGHRTLNGFAFGFETKKACYEFEANNPFDRVISWSLAEGKTYTKYICQMFMNDKVPEEVVTLKQLFGNKPKRVRIAKRAAAEKNPGNNLLNPAELFAKVQNGELSLEEFSKLIKG